MMIEQDPVSAYKTTYRDEFCSAAEKLFDTAAEDAKIDIAANAALAAELYKLIKEHDSHSSSKSLWLFFLWSLIIGALVWGGVIWYLFSNDRLTLLHGALFAAFIVLGAILLFTLIIPLLRQISEKLKALEAEISTKKEKALAQLAPLYQFFDWKTCQRLLSQIMPELQFDDFLTAESLQQLESQFDLSLSEEEDISLAAADSGTFYGYPFLITRFKEFDWGTKDWSGSLTITWKTREKDADGKYYWETHSETLIATLTKPCPEFSVCSAMYAGHTAVPALNFSRSPSELSGQNGFWAELGKKRTFKRLYKFSQNLQDESNYTMMSNRDFEILFHCTDRSDEVTFRQLFTPLAQGKMVKLLNDRESGYGDDFYYAKKGKYTMIFPEHLQDADIAPMPFYSEAFDFAEVKKAFLTRSCEFFRSIYFTFAPLFTIPLYNEPRLDHETPAPGNNISAAEIEAAVNFIGTKRFAHPQSITQDILSVKLLRQQQKTLHAKVSALGFKGVEHVEYVSKYGRDGRWHNVPVEWVEYIPVTKTTDICAARSGDAEIQAPLCIRRGIVYWQE